MDHYVKYGMLYSGALIEMENEEQTWGLYCIANQILTPSKYVKKKKKKIRECPDFTFLPSVTTSEN